MGAENSCNPDEFYMRVNLLGFSDTKFLESISNQKDSSLTQSREKRLLINDYWDYKYFQGKSLNLQIEEFFNTIETTKKEHKKMRECLVVSLETNTIDDMVKDIFSKTNKLKTNCWMPFVIFLCRECELEDEVKIKQMYPDLSQFKYIRDQRIFCTLKYNDDIENDYFQIIMDKLIRICSIYNELGDRFTIGKGDTLKNYDLNDLDFPATINLVTIGRSGQGKSTGVNCILNEIKAREGDGGGSTTKKLNYYQVSDYPIRILDIPGFEDEDTIKNAIKKFQELKKKSEELKENLHLILYFIRYTEAKTFLGLEYEFLSEIIKHSNSKLIYVITHTDKEEIEGEDQKEEYILKINQGVENICKDKLDKEKKESEKKKTEKQNEEIIKYLFASENNCVFLNFHKGKDNPVFGINEFFGKIIEFFKLTNDYIESNKKMDENSEEYKTKMNKEFERLKVRAKDAIFWEKIGHQILDFFGLGILLKKKIIKKLEGVFRIKIDVVQKYLDKKRKYEKLSCIKEKFGATASSVAGFVIDSYSLLTKIPKIVISSMFFGFFTDKLIEEFLEYTKDNKDLLDKKFSLSFKYLNKMKDKTN